jgi:hypothetical protein
MSRHPALGRFAESTATDESTQRVLVARLQDAGVLRSGAERWIALVDQPGPIALAMAPARARSGRHIAMVSALGAAVAALLLLGLLAWPQAPAPLGLELASSETTSIEALPGLVLEYDGTGFVGGDTRSVWLTWDQGRVLVDLEPESLDRLVIRTREATVTVLGTRFEVSRDAMGTHVSVTRGLVEVRCADAQVSHLRGGEQGQCEPVAPAALLGMARTLQRRGAPPERILEILDRAEAAAEPGAPMLGECIVIRLELLVAEGRLKEALEVSRRYLDAGQTARAAEIESFAGALEARLEPAPSEGK